MSEATETTGDISADGYQELALRTANPDRLEAERLFNAILGIIGEGGEIADVVGRLVKGDTLTHQMLLVMREFGAAVDLLKKHRHHGAPYQASQIKAHLTHAFQALALALYMAEHEHELTGEVVWNDDGSPEAVAARGAALQKEFGDLLWYGGGQGPSAVGLLLSQVMWANIAMLEARYPGAIFTTEASMARADEGGA